MALKTTYTRAALANEKTGQCPCCLRQQRASGKGGRLARHGWRETGRVQGQYGNGFQWGNCAGSALRPLEETDADAVTVINLLDKRLAETRAALAENVAKGADSYIWHKVIDYRDAEDAPRYQATLDNLGGLGIKAVVKATRVRHHSALDVLVTISRGADTVQVTGARLAKYGVGSLSTSSTYLTVPSWADLRERKRAELAQTITGFVAQRKSILAAIKHHHDNPSTGGEDIVRRGPALHLRRVWVVPQNRFGPTLTDEQRTRRPIACGAGRRGVRVVATEVEAEVTCTRCLNDIKKFAARKAKKVADEQRQADLLAKACLTTKPASNRKRKPRAV